MCVNPDLPSYIHSVYFPPDGKNVVYQASPEVRSAFAIYPKVLPSDLSATMEIKLSRDISFSRVCNGPAEARGYTFFQQHIKNQNKEIFTEPLLLTTSVLCAWANDKRYHHISVIYILFRCYWTNC